MKYKNDEFEYIDNNDWYLIKKFLDDIGYNKVFGEEINLSENQDDKEFIHFFERDDYFEVLYKFNKWKENHNIDLDSSSEKIKKNKYLKILQDEEFFDLIRYFNDEVSAEITIETLKKTYQNLKSNNLKKRGITARNLMIHTKLKPKESHKCAIRLYEDLYIMIFRDRKINTYGNVKKLRKLINDIFEITLKDSELNNLFK